MSDNTELFGQASLKNAFISYGRADSLGFAKWLNEKLVDQGYQIWFDFNDIPQGVDYQKQINAGIEDADNFIFVIAPHATNSPYCRKEVELAIAHTSEIPHICTRGFAQRNASLDFPQTA